MRGSQAPTLEAVARVAGVSRSTVSRVINNLPGVSKRAKLAVDTAIAELRYVPNQAARNLVTRRTNSIALVVSERGDRVFSDPFFAKILRGVYAGMTGSRRQLVLLMDQEDREDGALESYLCGGHVDGAVVVSLHRGDPLPARLVEAGLPVVLVGRPLSGIKVPYVDSDNFTGAAAAARHLITTGRRVLATIAGPQDMAAGVDRLAGWQACVPEPAERVAYSDFSVEGGARAMAELLAKFPDIDAVFAAADIIAVGALRTLAEHGKRVPDDIALVGFDDSVLATTTAPQLTTVRQDVEELGRTTTWHLLAQLAGDEPLPPSVLLPTELVERSST
ncbi:LacI family DNA-binding transcriptional regulator [Actinokineospora globicatena]|uniref:LacI family DNA-binding transcriptional regulator n=1 Tax=Actinokineospora globicatena TaxID=103729 RepID=UPI0020A2C989|nr:LacI family DNA-binding transcriptional regulator [Actinokineospora globicatena]MCP2302737.1 transcriptional regulator, LacI family [Actinokineospora globicatena]GLW75573.1 LacI family transcriptional regulator [Actinokineospora globicatena]GLW82413.1 LacI family transcriptional regulator [Actinokineospora globicatena]